MKNYKIGVVPGDGIGTEIMPGTLEVLDALAEVHGGFKLAYSHYPWSCDYYLEHGMMMPDDGIDQLAQHDAVFLGAVGNPKLVPDHVSLWGLLIKIRREFEQVINMRPAKQLPGIESPLKHPNGFDFIIVRENSEGEYSEVGGTIHRGEDEIAIQNAVFTKKATERVLRFAFELAKQRNRKVTSATKSNGIVHSMPFWDKTVKEVAVGYADVEAESTHIDALSAFFVTKPESFDIIAASNLFGDILSDIGAAIMGSIGVAPAGNINLNGKYPSMFEPVHGSAPDIVGKGIANPIGQIWTGKMMLEHLGEKKAADLLLKVVEEVIADGVKTPDLKRNATTSDVINEIKTRIFGI
ncbi:tartrate dehydrogenase [Pseudalkalibacillus salsuginis]|uniref:tartrate dehydrogenase n=1 Tax=Pseudalkalibacillus salsuginis TaxID=2910972 RepID=UPI001F438362|nr:tartrate dehydrogenase [Pseudalkalibacillus salsuginis]MCF6411311.1 tartrate dehydrogenase [Pseudalkalibacillus salsuginis]